MADFFFLFSQAEIWTIWFTLSTWSNLCNAGTATWGLSIDCLACACLGRWSSWGGRCLLQELGWDGLPWSASAAAFRRAALPPSCWGLSFTIFPTSSLPQLFQLRPGCPSQVHPVRSFSQCQLHFSSVDAHQGAQWAAAQSCKDRLRKLDLLSLENGRGSDFSLSKEWRWTLPTGSQGKDKR